MKLAKAFQSVDKKVIYMILGSALILIILIVGFLIIRDVLEDRSINAREEKKMAYNAENLSETTSAKNRTDLLYPEVIEELDLSMDLYRSKSFKWTEEEVSRMWIDPDAGDIDYFTDANHKLIWDILKDAP